MTSSKETKEEAGRKQRISRRGFLLAARNVLVGGAFFSVGGWKYSEFERGWLKVNEEEIQLAELPEQVSGLRIAHLSDLHLNDFMTPARFTEVVDKLIETEPDLILITGDMIDAQTELTEIPAYVEQLKRMQARLGKFAVLGNHDHWRDANLVRRMMKESGIEDISNRVAGLEIGGENIYLCGLDSFMEGRQEINLVLDALPDEGTAILLVHEPDYADISAVVGRFDLQLSGHSHGGQVYVPLFGPPIVPDFGRKYPRGRYQVGEMQLYTNRGVGMVAPYVRLNCRPEIALITLV